MILKKTAMCVKIKNYFRNAHDFVLFTTMGSLLGDLRFNSTRSLIFSSII